jgi:adenylate kinase family enzyme
VERVAVIGCSGSGKTTLANKLGCALGVQVVHIDSHYWRIVDGRRVESTPEEWRARHSELIAEPRWVLDGMKLGVLPDRLRRADAVIYLDLPLRSLIAGIARRRIQYRRQGDPERGIYTTVNWPMLKWVLTFRHKHRAAVLQLVNDFPGRRIVLKNRREVQKFLEGLPS